MLCLRKHVGGDELGVGGFIGNDEDFTGSRQKVDADSSNELALCFNNKDVTRTEDFFHGLDGFCSQCHGGDSLSAADLDNLGSATLDKGVKQCWVKLAVGPCR